MNRPVTSASNIFRRILCPGSQRMETGLYEEDSEYSAEGKLLHELYWTRPIIEWPEMLNASQRECLQFANYKTASFFEEVREIYGIPEDEPYIESKEPELQFMHPETNEILFPGHADLIRRWPQSRVTAIIDLKSGFAENDPAPDNYQLATYGVQDWQMTGRLPDARTAVALLQPRNFGPRFSMATYTGEQLYAAEAVLAAGYQSSQLPDAPLVAGEVQCHYCKAKTICSAYKAKFAQLVEIGTRAITTLTNDELVLCHKAIKFADKIKKEVSSELTRRIECGAIPGTLKNNGSEREVFDSFGLFQAFARHFAGNEAFTASRYDNCRSMSWGKLEEFIADITDLPESKAKELVREISAPFVTEKPKAKSPQVK